mmetsp:Transcript_109840/g.317569  ORF Transcript_109840/g.317569 Transcript_109840/m.317569 type:complete len:288 (-) Transcript_109840:444-1307(-)
MNLDEIGNVHWHFSDLSSVKLFDIAEVTNIAFREEVDSNSLTSETSRATDTVDVVFSVGREVKVDDQRNLLDIDTTGQKIRGDQDTGGTSAEFPHDNITFALVHISVHARDGEVALLHFLLQPVDLASGVAVDDSLGDGQSLVQIAERLELPLLSLNSNVELFNTLKGQLVLLDQNTDGLPHKTLSHLQNIQRHGSREQTNLDRLRKELENIINLILETTRKHFIGLIQKELTDVVQSKGTTVDHVGNTTGGTDDDVNTGLQSSNIVTNRGTSNAGMDLDVHVVTKS